ncbi:hypothetical protein DY000_02053916 [Brassica cretica]|uniref:Uncharacterized protein n=1 Tax=Brassica cretica TaxID=69181 RepID=A0ABQ7ADL0_BRACR|nr:hypothetical protein DY000_02053916 [Brassica cretica]
MSSEVYYRSWMDKPHLDPNTNLLTEEYVQGIGEFMRLVQQQPDAKSDDLIFVFNNLIVQRLTLTPNYPLNSLKADNPPSTRPLVPSTPPLAPSIPDSAAAFKKSNETVGTGGESILRDENGNEAQAPPSSVPTYCDAPLPDDEAQRRAVFDWVEVKLSESAAQDSNSTASLMKRREDEIEEERR